MKNYDKRIESSYFMYLDTNNNHLSKFIESFIKHHDKISNKGYFIEVNVEHPKKLFNHNKDLPILPKRKKIGKSKKLVYTVKDKRNCVVHIRTLKQDLNRGLILKKVHRVIQVNQKAWLKPYIDMNTKLRIKANNEFEKGFFKLMNNAVLGKTMENVRKHRDIKLVTTEKWRNQLVSEPNYHTTKYFSKNLFGIEMKKTKVKINKLIYLGMSILCIRKTLMYNFVMITLN